LFDCITMAEILQNAFQKAIDEQGEMEDKKSQKAPTIDSVIVTGPDIIQLPKTEVKEVVSDEGADAQEASAAEAKVPESEQRTSPVITTAAELNTSNPTKPTENDAGVDVTSTVEDPEVTVATVSDSSPTVMVTNNDGRTPRELNQKLTQPGENDSATDASAAEAKATNDNDGTVSQREVSQPPTVDQMVLDLKRKIAVAAESKSSDGTAEGSVEENKSSDATVVMSVEENKSSDGSAEGSVEENKSSDATAVESVEESKSLDGTAEGSVEESKSSDGTAKGSVEPAMVSLSALSAMSPSPGPKVDEYQPATQYSPSPGPFTEKNRPRTRSTMSPDPKKKQSPVSAVPNESLMRLGRNFDALVGMDSVSKAAFHRNQRRYQKYTQAYLDHAYNIAHDFRKCDIRALHKIEPKEGGAVQEDEDKKDCNQTRPRNWSKLEVHPPSLRIHLPTKW
jgi:hypothetical protein